MTRSAQNHSAAPTNPNEWVSEITLSHDGSSIVRFLDHTFLECPRPRLVGSACRCTTRRARRPDLTMTHDIHDATRGRNGRRCWVHVRSRFTSISVDRPVKQESYNGLVHIFCNTVYTG